MEFQEQVAQELKRAREKNKPFNSFHEGYAVLLEEVDELWDEVKKKASKRSKESMQEEVIQIAAMCQRFYEDLLK